jgi:hypothetical protein
MCTGVAHFTVVHRGDLVDIGPSIDCPYFLSQSLDKVEKAHVMKFASSREAVVEGERQEP